MHLEKAIRMKEQVINLGFYKSIKRVMFEISFGLLQEYTVLWSVTKQYEVLQVTDELEKVSICQRISKDLSYLSFQNF